MMSEQLKLFLKLKRKKAEEVKAENQMNFKPAQGDINFQIIDMVTFNIIENMTKYKNREIDINILNKELSINLSFILTKINPKKKLIKENNNKDNNNKENKNNNNIINNFGIYFPMNRITFIKESFKNNKNKKKDKKNVEVFLPSSQSFLDIKYYKKNDNSDSSDSDLKLSYIKISKSKESSLLYEEENSISLLSEDSFINNKGLKESNKNNKKKKASMKFIKYKELVDYYECPLLQNETKKEKFNDFINLFNNLDNIFGGEENFDFNYYLKNNKEKIFIDNIDIIISNELKKDEALNNNNLIINSGKEMSNIFDDSVFINNKNNNPEKMKEISESLKKNI